MATSGDALQGMQLASDAAARLRQDLAGGNYALVPNQGATFDSEKRIAWWRIHPRSGETIAVTDEGLHQTLTEYYYVKNEGTEEVRIVRLQYVDGELVGHEASSFPAGSQRLGRTIFYLRGGMDSSFSIRMHRCRFIIKGCQPCNLLWASPTSRDGSYDEDWSINRQKWR